MAVVVRSNLVETLHDNLHSANDKQRLADVIPIRPFRDDDAIRELRSSYLYSIRQSRYARIRRFGFCSFCGAHRAHLLSCFLHGLMAEANIDHDVLTFGSFTAIRASER